MKPRNTIPALLALAFVAAGCDAIKPKTDYYAFSEEGPTPPLVFNEKTNQEALTPVTTQKFANSDEYSPAIIDDRFVAFVSDTSGTLDIWYTSYRDGGTTAPKQLVSTDNQEKAPFVRVSEASATGDIRGTVYFVTSGSGRFEVFRGDVPRVVQQTQVYRPTKHANWPDLDAEGRMLFSSLNGDGEYETWLKDESGDSRLLDGQRARWNPKNANEFVYTKKTGDHWQVFKKNMQSGDLSQLTSNSSDSFDPVYSHDGGRIAFVSNQNGSSDIWTMNSDGSNQAFVTVHGAPDCQPVWTPDDKAILFSSQRGEKWDIFMIRLDEAMIDHDGA